MPEQFDAIIIGAGQSGPFLAARLAEAGRAVALIERDHLGGTCVNDGCTPTKTMVASARAAWSARHAAQFGVVFKGPVTVDMAAVKARKDKVVAASVNGLTDWLGGLRTLKYFKGEGSFVSPTEVKVGKRVLTAPQIFINTGASPFVPPIPGAKGNKFVYTSDTMMERDELPEDKKDKLFTLFAAELFTSRSLADWAGKGLTLTDDHPELEFSAPIA